ncbi:MAG: hypothetical protein CBD97_02185 [Pelagibacteraceae bacterium TMED237]|nr:MAG: hypothetical protein CBD97_02185 [Pelagibacteraceae bacterium TMED237]
MQNGWLAMRGHIATTVIFRRRPAELLIAPPAPTITGYVCLILGCASAMLGMRVIAAKKVGAIANGSIAVKKIVLKGWLNVNMPPTDHPIVTAQVVLFKINVIIIYNYE